ncbi:AAA domain-containing protein [Aureliella helgolandensis]|uniref:ATP-dependent RecD-like DNA helicase n=1 Tax=Aureliella helgolandensis TaxID=2527968 RepID=A0A518G1J4_9BACT|nr:AAA domain-containing protein [Aureliella helgolandensis]QDV22462.1 ATP-dependent RecD-like DNA helicase [Aureliella helgolandensis]
MANVEQCIEYQLRCYQADNRETGIGSLWQDQHRHVRFFEGEELLLSGTVPQLPLVDPPESPLERDVFKYRRDKSLIYGVLPIVGSGAFSKRLPKQLCAPLAFFHCTLTPCRGSHIALQPELNDLKLNWPVLLAIAAETKADEGALEAILLELPSPPWPRSQLHSIAASLSEALPAVDFTPLGSFPQLLTSKQLQQTRASASAALQCHPAAAMALIPNSPDTRGVLFELSELSAASRRRELSPPLNAIFTEEAIPSNPRPSHRPLAPTVLSAAQRQALANAASQPLSIIVGPPGTGKSHTISAIVLDHLARNESVLVASKMDQAVDVVTQKIEDLLGPHDAVVRGGRKRHMRQMTSTLDNLLSGIHSPPPSDVAARKLESQLRKRDRQLSRVEKSLKASFRREIAWGSRYATPPASMFERLYRPLAKGFHDWLLSTLDCWEEIAKYEQLLESRVQHCQLFLRQRLHERVQRLLRRRRQDLSKFLQALKARSDGKQQRLFREIDFSLLLDAFPAWLCKLSDLSDVLPSTRQLFDVAILDEASQCDIASCLPLMQRARRVVIVGDSQQLKHISFLAEDRQAAIAQECQLSESQQQLLHYRNQSIIDLCSDSARQQEQVVFLNEHFRSLPPIIRFSNSEFYRNSLSIMRHSEYPADSEIPAEEELETGLKVLHVAGQRDGNGRNATEAELIVKHVVGLFESPLSGSPEVLPSIGVVSPFREQVEYLRKQFDQHLSLEQMQSIDLLVGTAHSFQGEERDVVHLSLTLDDQAHSASFRFLESPNLLNVAITRARHLQRVYHSFQLNTLRMDSLVRRYLESAPHHRATTPKGQNFHHDEFRSAVAAALSERGHLTEVDFPIGGFHLDLLMRGHGSLLGIDLVGYPGMLMDAFQLERYRMLRRAGLHVYPLSYRSWLQSPEAAIERALSTLKAFPAAS